MPEEERDTINELFVETGLDAADYAAVADALATLRASVPDQAPAPSAELAALLSGGAVVPLARRRLSPAVIASGVAAAVVLATGGAAAANVLPDPAQQFLSDLSDKVLPFHLPAPDEESDKSQVEDRDDNGLHVGNGEGLGKTDNPGKHLGQLKNTPQGPKPTPHPSQGQGHDGDKADNHNKGGSSDTAPGQTRGPSPSEGKPTTEPKKAEPSKTPKPETDEGESSDPESPRGSDNGQGKGSAKG